MRQKMFRRRSYLERDALGTTDQNVVLFEANEACTIRRIIGYLKQESTVASSSDAVVVNFSLEIAPNGVVTNSAFSATALDVDVSQEYLGGGLLVCDGEHQVDTVMWESKGMRKLRKGDQLVLSHSANLAIGTLNAYFDIFASI